MEPIVLACSEADGQRGTPRGTYEILGWATPNADLNRTDPHSQHTSWDPGASSQAELPAAGRCRVRCCTLSQKESAGRCHLVRRSCQRHESDGPVLSARPRFALPNAAKERRSRVPHRTKPISVAQLIDDLLERDIKRAQGAEGHARDAVSMLLNDAR